MPKQARTSFEGPYDCQKPWPEECFVQCGGKGIVLGIKSGKEPYRTAFFEAFPAIGEFESSFIRGEGKTIPEAEEACWNSYQKKLNCPKHEFEARDRVNGAGFCKHCNLFQSDVLPPKVFCQICNIGLNKANGGDWHGKCKKHYLESEESAKYKKEMLFLIGKNILSLRDILDQFENPTQQYKQFFETKTYVEITKIKNKHQKQLEEDLVEFAEYGGDIENIQTIVDQLSKEPINEQF